jgi:aryl-alcohol dehydrogenase-like predicted oxidoreductase/outer membrane protein assembly factor BamB
VLGAADVDSSVAVTDGVAYVGTYDGKLFAFAVDGCGAKLCEPLWVGRVGDSGAPVTSSPAVGGGSVFVASNDGRLYAFPAGATGCGHPTCNPTWWVRVGGPAFTVSPTVAGDTVFIVGALAHQLLALPAAGCGQAVCEPVWRGDLGLGPSGATTPAVANGMVYVATQGSPSPRAVGVVTAFDVTGCGRDVCQPTWTGINFASGFESSPAVSGDVVFVAKGPASGFPVDAALYAYDARGCGAKRCAPVAFVQVGEEQFYLGSSVAVAGDQVLFASEDNADELTAFGRIDRMAVLGLGLAALGRPGYLNVGHGDDIGPERTVDAMEQRCRAVCDAAWAAGIRWFDAARSYGLAEDFLARWLADRDVAHGVVSVSSKWGYTYTAGWQVDADPPEVKDHAVSALERQWPESAARLGPWLTLYQVHSATLDSGVLADAAVHRALAALPAPVGLSVSGPRQADAIRRALDVTVGGVTLFDAVQATWNVLEPSVGPALAEAKDAGWTVIVKEALANGRLARGSEASRLGPEPDVVALRTALAQPFVDVVLSGAATVEQLRSNARAAINSDAAVAPVEDLAVDPATYWAERAAMPWT